jgi:tripartite-type tricarboxylate transporter receptor subunit TctC
MIRVRQLATGFLLALLASASTAQAWPAKPIRLIVPFPPGGGTDFVARIVAEGLTKAIGANVIVDNRPGAGGNIGLDLVAKAAPDGYTLGFGQTSNLAINPYLYPKMPFDPMKDLAPVANVASQPMVLVVTDKSPFKSVADIVAAAKKSPRSVRNGLAGNGTVGHLAGELFARRAGIKFTNVPYKGAAPALTDLMGGQTDLMFATPQSVVSLIKSGKVRALAVSSSQRITVLPNVPTIGESGYAGFEAVDWKALVAPAGTPPAVIKTLNAAVNQALGQPSTLAELLADGSAPMGGTPEQAAQKIKSEHARWGALIREAGITLE